MKHIPLTDLHPAPWNPRIIKDDRFKGLCDSLKNDPDFMELRPVLATKDGTIYGGNMRYRAAEFLKWKTIPAIITDIPEKLAKERAVKDNGSFGEWSDTFSTFIEELGKQGVDMSQLGLDQNLLNLIEGTKDFLPATLEDQGKLDEKKLITCPECGHEFAS